MECVVRMASGRKLGLCHSQTFEFGVNDQFATCLTTTCSHCHFKHRVHAATFDLIKIERQRPMHSIARR
jgi:hypothetical protein